MKNRSLVPFARRLRKTATPAEKFLWFTLKQIKLPSGHFRRQVPLELYIVDFAYLPSKLIIEIDGESHFLPDGVLKDKVREQALNTAGFRILRFTNADVMQNCEGVVEEILKHLYPPTPPFFTPHPYPPR